MDREITASSPNSDEHIVNDGRGLEIDSEIKNDIPCGSITQKEDSTEVDSKVDNITSDANGMTTHTAVKSDIQNIMPDIASNDTIIQSQYNPETDSEVKEAASEETTNQKEVNIDNDNETKARVSNETVIDNPELISDENVLHKVTNSEKHHEMKCPNSNEQITHSEATSDIDSELKDGVINKNTTMEDTNNDNHELTSGVDEVNDLQQLQVIDFFNTGSSCCVFWFDVLPGGRLVLLGYDENDLHSSQLSLYSPGHSLLSKLGLPFAFSADTFDDNQFIIPIEPKFNDNPKFVTKDPAKHYLQTVNMDDDQLVFGAVIKTRMTPLLVLKYSDRAVLIATLLAGGRLCFQILNLAGKVLKHVFIGEDLSLPLFMRLDNDKKTIYVVDMERGCYGFNFNGDTVFRYSEQGCGNYLGLAVDQNNFIYIAAEAEEEETHALIKVAPAGEVLEETDIIDMYPLKYNGGKLSMTRRNDNTEVVICYIQMN